MDISVEKYIEEKKELYNILFNFLEEAESRDLNFSNLIHFINSRNYLDDGNELLLFLRLLTKIANNHHRSLDLIDKIKQIVDNYKIKIKQTLSNIEIFNTIKSNKILLLHFIQNEIIALNKGICKEIIEKVDNNGLQYCHFFIKEIKKNFKEFIEEKRIKTIENELLSKNPNFYDDFDEKIQKGENDSYICSLIRNDSIEDFIIYVNRTNLSLSNTFIEKSIFETNSFLLEKKSITLIEYAAFFGSIQIFQYLKINNVEMNSNLLFYSIHGRNAEIIHLLEESRILPPYSNSSFYLECLIESIKCHHSDFANYFENNFLNQKDLLNENLVFNIFNYCNYFYFPLDLNRNDIFVNLCFANYDKLVNLLMQENEKNIIDEIIIIKNFLAAANNKTEIIYYLLSKKTKIEENCFIGNKLLSKIAIPSTIESIDDRVFRWCSLLTQVSIPLSVTTIGSYAFSGCSSLKIIKIPYSVKTIGVSAFNGCKSLKQIEIPSSVESIGYQSFSNCSSLEHFLISSYLIDIICSQTFEKCISLIQINIPSSVTEIVENAFKDCCSLRQIDLPSSLTLIGDYAFYNCSSLIQITIPSSVKEIHANAFKQCSSLKHINFIKPTSLSIIDECTFANCTSLKEIRIPENIITIKSYAFAGCYSLLDVILPSSIRSIKCDAFTYCTSLAEVAIPAVPLSIDDDAFPSSTELLAI